MKNKFVILLLLAMSLVGVFVLGACQPTEVADQTAPTITIADSSVITVEEGESFTLPDYQVSDDVSASENITVKIEYCKSGTSDYTAITTDTFSFENEGSYVIKYTATDEAGNSAYAKIDVKVSKLFVDDTAPELTVESADKVNIKLGTAWQLPEYKVSDDVSASENITVVIEWQENMSEFKPVEGEEILFDKAGEYIVRFTATDEAGNSTKKIINISVVEHIANYTIEVSGNFSGYEKELLVDGDYSTAWAPNSTFSVEKPWVQFNYDMPVRLNKIVFYARPNNIVDTTKTVLVEVDGMRYFTTVLSQSGTDSTGWGELILTEQVVTQSIRITITEMYNDRNDVRPGFGEIEIDCVAVEDEAPVIDVNKETIEADAGVAFDIPTATSDSSVTVSYLKKGETTEIPVSGNQLTIEEAGEYQLIYRTISASGFGSAEVVDVVISDGTLPIPAPAVTSSSIFNEPSFKNEHLIDGNPGTQWAPMHRFSDETPWVKLNYQSSILVSAIKIWGRGNGLDLTLKVLVRFSDGTVNEITLDETETGEITFAEAKRTSSIYIAIVEAQGDFPGLNEVQVTGCGADDEDVLPPVISGDDADYLIAVGEELTLRNDVFTSKGNLKVYYRSEGDYSLTEITSGKVTFDRVGNYVIVYIATDDFGNSSIFEVGVSVTVSGEIVPQIEVQSTFPESTYNKDHLMDGNTSTAWAAEWSGNLAWITLTYEKSVTISSMKFFDRIADSAAVDKTIELTVTFGEGETAVVKTVNFNGSQECELVLDEPVTTTFVKIEFTKLVQDTNSNPGLTEIEVNYIK